MSQFNAPAYDIQRPTGQCAFTGQALEPGASYIATLVEVDPDPQNPKANPTGLKRLDVAMAAWQEGSRPERLFSFWKSIVPEPNQKKKVFVDDQVLLNLLKRLEDADQPQRLAFRFVLALILMRKKLLRYDGSRLEETRIEKEAQTTEQQAKEQETGEQDQPIQDQGKTPQQASKRELWIMTPKGEDQPLEILNPQLDDEQIQQVTSQLGEILEGEL